MAKGVLEALALAGSESITRHVEALNLQKLSHGRPFDAGTDLWRLAED